MHTRFRYVALVLLALGTAAGAQAQTKLPPRRAGVAAKPKPAANGVGLKDGLTMQNGRVVLTELGLTNPLTADKKLLSGTTISPTGLVTAATGTTTQLAEGDVVSLSGRVTSHAAIAEQDSLLKVKQYDLKYPGKRAKMEAEKSKRAEMQAKALAKRDKGRA